MPSWESPCPALAPPSRELLAEARLHRHPLAALGAAAREHGLSALGLHPAAKAVFLRTPAAIRLKCALGHETSLLLLGKFPDRQTMSIKEARRGRQFFGGPLTGYSGLRNGNALGRLPKAAWPIARKMARCAVAKTPALGSEQSAGHAQDTAIGAGSSKIPALVCRAQIIHTVPETGRASLADDCDRSTSHLDVSSWFMGRDAGLL